MNIVTTLLTFLAVLSLLVLAHELGHFVVAKRAGIKVQEFGFGYPPRLFGVRVGETIYSINLLPLGGFVKMLGENGSPSEPRSFASKGRGTRAAVLAAGSGMNLLLAPLLFGIALMLGEPVPSSITLSAVQTGSPAEEAGLRAGDVLLRVDNRPVTTADDVRAAIRVAGERDMPVLVRRDGQEQTLHLVPRANPQDGRLMIGVGLSQEYAMVKRPFWEAVPLGVQRTWETLKLFADGIRQMVTREQPAELAGPVGIAQMTGRAAQAGLSYLLQFTAFLSLNLAVFNMLPIPGLDGARLAFVGIEGIRRGRRINPQVEGVIHFVGLMLLITLMIFVSYNDVRRILPG